MIIEDWEREALKDMIYLEEPQIKEPAKIILDDKSKVAASEGDIQQGLHS